MAAPDADDIDHSGAATVIHFDRPLPLFRGPISTGQADDPSLGPHVLAFRNPESFFSAQRFCHSKLLEQCEAGVRIGCSVSASSKCRPPWWKFLVGAGTSAADFKERERCEEREMVACLEQSKGKCVGFAKENSSAVFRIARVARRGCWRVGEKEAVEFIGWISCLGAQNEDLGFKALMVRQLGPKSLVYEVTNCRGSELLGDE